ncbi:hypothetical protein HNR02_006210 [Amycolatopsis endophytica]|uniref:Uncharacterized protein n=1 Tax=Amycolatopsis endophytica TaxID=860233 RepID=A0A853BDJ9_9PSEU|nr:hypothetical protein [Amycolatopsis endophytica]
MLRRAHPVTHPTTALPKLPAGIPRIAGPAAPAVLSRSTRPRAGPSGRGAFLSTTRHTPGPVERRMAGSSVQPARSLIARHTAVPVGLLPSTRSLAGSCPGLPADTSRTARRLPPVGIRTRPRSSTVLVVGRLQEAPVGIRDRGRRLVDRAPATPCSPGPIRCRARQLPNRGRVCPPGPLPDQVPARKRPSPRSPDCMPARQLLSRGRAFRRDRTRYRVPVRRRPHRGRYRVVPTASRRVLTPHPARRPPARSRRSTR